MRTVPRWFVIASAALAVGGTPVSGTEWKLLGYGAVRVQQADGRPSYLAGDWGKFDLPAIADDDSNEGSGQLAVALDVDWTPSLRTFVHIGGRVDPVTTVDSTGRELGDPVGLLEAFVEYRRALSDHSELQTRGGFFFLNTSFENIDPLWTSPYTLSLSALNSWIGEEVRPVGLDIAWLRRDDSGGHVRFAVTAFGANDTMGTLIAWRGFAFHDRLTPWGGEVPLHRSVFPAFPKQERSTEPFRADLDGEPGFSARGEFQGGNFAARGSYLDTRGDRDLHPSNFGQYSWRTRFGWLGGEAHVGLLTLVGEWGQGSTTMGFPGRGVTWVDADFEVGYLLASIAPGPFRFSARYDTFEVVERDGNLLDRNDEDGIATTLAAFWKFGGRFRLGLEAIQVDAQRPRLAVPAIEGDQLKAELRVRF